VTEQHTRRESEQAALDAHAAADAAVQRIARAAGGTGHPSEVTAGLQAARRLQLAAAALVLQHIRAARRTGTGWHEIGALLGLGPHAAAEGLTVATAAFRFAAGPAASPWQEATFAWPCRCRQMITEHEPSSRPPAELQHGHAPGCPQLAAAGAAWNAAWTQESGT
jgi:hypothetical protein